MVPFLFFMCLSCRAPPYLLAHCRYRHCAPMCPNFIGENIPREIARVRGREWSSAEMKNVGHGSFWTPLPSVVIGKSSSLISREDELFSHPRARAKEGKKEPYLPRFIDPRAPTSKRRPVNARTQRRARYTTSPSHVNYNTTVRA